MGVLMISLLVLIGLPFVFLMTLWRAKFGSKIMWILDLLTTAIVIIWLFQFANWLWISIYLKYVWLILLLFVGVRSYLKVQDLPLTQKFKLTDYFTASVYVMLIIIFGFYNVQVLQAHTYERQAVDLEFPLENGKFIVGQGGSTTMMNYHSAYEDQKYALDILALNTYGARAIGLYPKDNEKYEIFGKNVMSPCKGTVLEVENSLPDLTPSDTDPENPAGNHVTLTCDGMGGQVLLAHMQEGSVEVAERDQLSLGDPIGKVGNSGNTSEPHLHIHAEIDGQGLPITFKNKFLVRNKIMK